MSANVIRHLRKTDNDVFNADVIDGVDKVPNTTPQKLGPITLGSKSSTKILRESLGPLKKLPRERAFLVSRSGKGKLPPPPLGKSLGHGIIKV